MKVYLDLVMGLNFLVDFFLILGTNRISGCPPSPGRSAGAAALGGIYSGLVLVSETLAVLPVRLAAAAGIAGTAFGWNRGAWYRGAVFLLLSLALGGMAGRMREAPGAALILSAGGLWLLCRVIAGGRLGRKTYLTVELEREGRHLRQLALLDTGNELTDPITGEQVVVAGAGAAQQLLGLSREQLLHPVSALLAVPGLRLIPYRAVGQPGSMLAAMVFPEARVNGKQRRLLVAFAPQELGRGQVYQMLAGGNV